MRKLFVTAVLLAAGVSAFAQTTGEEFLDRYSRLVKNVGNSGVGVETLLNKWEAAFPEDENMLAASFLYYYEKCQENATVARPSATYLGQKPVLQLKDSLGNDVNYFYDTSFDDEMFGLAQQYIEKANRISPDKLENRFAAVTALVNYEKESPDMALSKLKELVAYHYGSKPAWTYNGEPVDDETFRSLIQEYCFSFFKLATPSGYEAFRSLSELMLQHKPNDVLFMDNLGSYYLVGKDEPKTALKYYDKVLKLKSDDLTAIQNSIILSRKMKNAKLEKKYLAMLVSHAEDDMSRKSAQARLDYLNGKK